MTDDTRTKLLRRIAAAKATINELAPFSPAWDAAMATYDDLAEEFADSGEPVSRGAIRTETPDAYGLAVTT